MSEEKQAVQESNPQEKKELTRQEIIKQLAAGTLELITPIRGGGEDITKLEYDFNRLTGLEFADALDSDTKANVNAFRLSFRQALFLFATAAAKCEKRLDARDIRERMGAADAEAAIQCAMVFFNASTIAARTDILRK